MFYKYCYFNNFLLFSHRAKYLTLFVHTLGGAVSLIQLFTQGHSRHNGCYFLSFAPNLYLPSWYLHVKPPWSVGYNGNQEQLRLDSETPPASAQSFDHHTPPSTVHINFIHLIFSFKCLLLGF
jgi:hypothetical protein